MPCPLVIDDTHNYQSLNNLTNMQIVFTVFFPLLFSLTSNQYVDKIEDYPLACDHPIYCHGPILEAVQLNEIFDDDKTFVDMKLKFPTNVIMENFKRLKEQSRNPTRAELSKFVEDNFEDENAFETLTYKEEKKWIDTIKFREENLNKLLKMLLERFIRLKKQIKRTVRDNQSLYSLLFLYNPYYVLGDKHSEQYYWESYWLVNVLYNLNASIIAGNIMDNCYELQRTFQLIPQGNRIYYSRRTQAPMMILMEELFWSMHLKRSYQQSILLKYEREFDFWRKSRSSQLTVNGITYNVAQYGSKTRGPRPEMYRHDWIIAQALKSEEERERFYMELKLASESGWEGMVSRWMIGDNFSDPRYFKPSYIVPVDLNAILCANARILRDMFGMINDQDKWTKYNEIYEEFLDTMENLFWNPDVGIWLDYDMVNLKRRNQYFASNFVPLWVKCYREKWMETTIYSILAYVRNMEILTFDGGIPASLVETGYGWDFPYAWAPFHHYMIVGFNDTGSLGAHLAFEIATRYLKANMMNFKITGNFFDKLTVLRSGYGEQADGKTGFGWTGGVLIDLLLKYRELLQLPSINAASISKITSFLFFNWLIILLLS